MTTQQQKGRQHKNRLRIIGGTWRGRKLNFPDLPGLRPTSDRIRETLFNWIQTEVVGANCLDLFAGSGALGIEALSRGAKYVVFVDSQKTAIEAISNNLKILDVSHADFVLSTASDYLRRSSGQQAFDLIFLDPPFGQDMLMTSLNELQQSLILKPMAKIYVETEMPLDEKAFSHVWKISKAKKAGKVFYYLISFSG